MSISENSKDTQKDREMVDYLLGEMSKDAEERFEERYFADDEMFERFLVVKEELIDDYIQGQLSESDRERFERRFFNSSRRRQQVAFAHALKQKLSDSSVKALNQVEVTSRRQLWFSFWSPRALIWATATAVVVLILGLGWFISENWRLRTELSALRNEKSEQLRREQEMQQQLAKLRAQASSDIAASSPTPTPLSSPRVSPRMPPVSIEPLPTIVLIPGVRSTKDLPKATLASSARRLSVRLLLDNKPGYRSYSAVLSVNGREIERHSGLRAQYKDDSYSITAEFSATSLGEGEYGVTLYGHDSKGKPKEVEKYRFVTIRQ